MAEIKPGTTTIWVTGEHWNQNVFNRDWDGNMAMIVHELGHIADLIFGSDAWKIISPDANVMGSTQAGYDNIKMVQEACFPGAPGEL